VFRTEDVWQRCNQFIETAEFSIRVSPSHSYNAGRAGLGWMVGWFQGNVYATCSDCVVVLALTSGESFWSTTGVHSRPCQLFINKIVDGDL
jgi:hypothetical protein